MKIIKGNELNHKQRAQVLSAYIYRWTSDNPRRKSVWNNVVGKPTVPLITDNQWLTEHAFWFLNDGSRSARTHTHAEPAFMADEATRQH